MDLKHEELTKAITNKQQILINWCLFRRELRNNNVEVMERSRTETN